MDTKNAKSELGNKEVGKARTGKKKQKIFAFFWIASDCDENGVPKQKRLRWFFRPKHTLDAQGLDCFLAGDSLQRQEHCKI